MIMLRDKSVGEYLRKNSLLILLAFLCIANTSWGQTPVASFSVPNAQGCVPYSVQFTNTSQNAVSYQWSFGNGNTSVVANPNNVFTVAGTFNVALTVFNASGQSNTTSSQITIHPKPLADFNVNQTSGCQGSQVFTFQNQSTLFDSCVWDFGDGTTSNLFNPQHVYSIFGTVNVTLVVYSKQFGCSDIKVKNAFVTIYPAPTGVISVNDSVTCDKSFNFQFNSSMQNASTWQWNFGDGFTSSSVSPSHIYADTGKYNVTLVLTSNNGCTNTISLASPIHIKWNPTPTTTIGDDTVCIPANILFHTNQYANALYSWNFGNGIVKSGASIYYLYPDSGLYPVTLNVVYSNGCQQTVNAGSVRAFKKPDFVFWMTNHTGCAPLNVQCVNQPNGNYTWLWDFGDGTTSTQQVPSHVYTNQGVYSVTLTGTSTNGCTYSYTQGLKINVFSPTAAFTTDITSGCPPLTVNFTNNSGKAVNYIWDFGDGTSSTQTHPTHIYTSSGTYTVKLISSDAGGCRDTLIRTNIINVAAPVVNYQTPPVVNGCAPYAVNFSDASGAAAFLWNFGDGTSSTSANPYHVYNSPGIYTVSLTTWMPNGGCEQYIQNFQTFNIDGAYPGFTYTISPCPPYEVFFTDTSINASSWQWSFGDGGSSFIQNPSHVYPGPGVYSIKLICTTAGGCNSTLNASNAIVINGLGANATSLSLDTVPPLNVQFNANSTGATWWLWNFGDGNTSSLENPLHVYQSLGPFIISLTIGNDSCQYTYTYPPITFGPNTGTGGGLGGVLPSPPPREYHCAPHTVSFSNPDPTAISYLWDFGDGITSTYPSPTHVYSDSGVFVTMLYLFYAAGVIDSVQFSDSVFVVEPISDFAISQTNLCSGVIIDVNTNAPGNYFLWDFGSGVNYSTPSASHTYPNVNSSYMISLNVKDTNNCSSFIAKSFAVTAVNAISASLRRACANDSILFNSGNVNYAQYLWDFGDGTFSSQKNPMHAYADSGLFSASLQVVDVNGCVQNFVMAYFVEVFNPKADFTYAAITSNCGSGTVVVLLNNLSNGSTSWLWQFGDGTNSNLFNPPQTGFYLPGYNGFYGITLIANKNVCSDTLTINNAIYAAKLVANFSYTLSSECVPAIAVFADSSMDAVSWLWDFGDGDTSTQKNPTHQYISNPRDSITLTVKDMYGCVKTKIMPSPKLTEAVYSLSATEGCTPLVINFADSSSNAVSWLWNFGDGTTSTASYASHTYLNDGFYNISLIVTSLSGCKDTLQMDSLVEINTPIADFTLSNDSGCAPLLVSFVDQSTNAFIWNWSLGNGNISMNTHPSLIYSNPGNYNVKLVIENKFGCKDSLTLDSAVVVQGPVPNFTVSSEIGCSPFPVSFYNATIGAVKCEWHFGDGIVDSIFAPTHIYNSPGTYSVTLYAFDTIGCSAIYSYPVPIVIGLSPTVNYNVDVNTGCEPLTININDLGTIADSLVYDMGDGTIISGFSPSHTYTTAGNYIITLIAYNQEGCTDTLVYADTIHVLAQPHADFTVDYVEGCSPLTVELTNISSGLSGASLNWNFGDGSVSSGFNANHIYVNPGLYTVSLSITNLNGCSDSVYYFDLIDVYDDIPPPITKLFRVTVNESDETELTWQQTNVNDLDYYEVYRYNPASLVFDTIAKVVHSNTGVNVTVPSYKDLLVNTNGSSYTYKVQAVDKCGYRQDLSLLKAHETILLNATAGFQSVSLAWSPYNGCSILGYEIFRQDYNGSAFNSIATVDSLTQNFIDTSTFCPREYMYKVKALEICGNPQYDSWSNQSFATPTSLISDQFVDVVRSTVVDNQFVLTEWMPPVVLPGSVLRYDVYRSTDQVNFALIASVPTMMHEYSDFNVDINSQEYYYKILVSNICDVESKEGQKGSSILLRKIEISSGNILKWTQYQEWASGVEYYVVEKLNELGVWVEMDRVPGAITEWEEE